MQIDRVVVISLRRRPERLAAFEARLPADWPWPRPEPWAAIDGQLVPKPDWFSGSPGAWGCYQSHNRILEECLGAGVERVAIFEDDATFVPDFAYRLAEYAAALPADCGQAYLGGQHLAPPSPVNELVVKAGNINRTHAYALVSRKAIEALYRHQHSGKHWNGRHHVDHHYGRAQRAGVVAAYAPTRWLCGQAAGTSDIANRGCSERWWQR